MVARKAQVVNLHRAESPCRELGRITRQFRCLRQPSLHLQIMTYFINGRLVIHGSIESNCQRYLSKSTIAR